MPVTKIADNEDFAPFVNTSQGKLVLLDFYADWCGPCKNIAPFVESLSNDAKYADKVSFAKVDIQSCDSIADSFKVSGIPYFVFMRQGKVVDTMTGANKAGLKEKLDANLVALEKQTDEAISTSSSIYGIPKSSNLADQIDKKASECLNEDDEHPWTNAVMDSGNSGTLLKSDCDEQLLLRIVFQNKVKLYGFKMIGLNGAMNAAPSPDKVRIFINQTNALDFDKAENGVPTLDVDVDKDGCSENTDAIVLPKLKFANVDNITLFIPGNSAKSDITVLRSLIFIGNTHAAKPNMEEFKRVSGKVGEGC